MYGLEHNRCVKYCTVFDAVKCVVETGPESTRGMDGERMTGRKTSSPVQEVKRKLHHGKSSSSVYRYESSSLGENGGNLWNGRQDGNAPSSYDTHAMDAERVRVTIRVRPPTLEESELQSEPVMDIDPTSGIVVLHRDESTEFQFDAVLPPSASQADVYRVAARPVVADVLNGYNGTVMAYGQTGAGKTYTLSCTQEGHLGIIPRAAAEVFSIAKADERHHYRVSMSYIQIYMEMIQDLLRPSSSNMQIRESENGVYLSGVEEVEVSSEEHCLNLLALGERNRAVAFTKLNAHSSRSHAIAIITVEKRKKGLNGGTAERRLPPRSPEHPEERKAAAESKEKILVGKLFLVDLAGSERLKKSGSEGLRAIEAKSVNLSLTSLGKCINARADPLTTHVPFRDSKLTRLLQESLGGNAKTSLVVNVASTVHHVSESMSSLLFGSRAMKVKTKAHVNEEEDYRYLSRSLQEAMDLHDDRVHSLEVVVYSQDEQLAQAKARLDTQATLLAHLQSELEEMTAAHERELSAREASWQDRLQQAQDSALNALEEAQGMYRENLNETVKALNLQRDTLSVALRESQSRLAELEEQVRTMEAIRDDTASKLENREAEVRKILLEEVNEKERNESAAIVIQKTFRRHKHSEVVQQLVCTQKKLEEGGKDATKLQAEKNDLQEIALAAGHSLVAEAIASMTSAVLAVNHRFITPRNQL